MGGAKRIQFWRAVYNSILKSGLLQNNFKMLVRLVKLQYYRAVKGFTILLNDARPKPGNATARTHCGKHTGHTARMAKGDNIQ